MFRRRVRITKALGFDCRVICKAPVRRKELSVSDKAEKKKVTTRGNRAINNRKFLHECRRRGRRRRRRRRAVTVKYV